MRRAMSPSGISIVALLASLFVGVSIAGPIPEPIPQRRVIDHLRGIRDVAFLLYVNTKAVDFPKSEVDRDTELKLRLAGLRVLRVADTTGGEREMEKGRPLFHLIVVDVTAGGRRSVTVHAVLGETVRPIRDPKLVFDVTTWEGRELRLDGEVSRPDWVGSIRSMVADAVDEFVNDYLYVNPK